ncbi:MAG TPA: Ig-like domain-containing protein [Thermoplasmata archaeon]|nr:Ig-like domain-containing protein [Thermoplasmata archaeon]
MASKGAIVAIALVMVLSGLIVPTISSRAPAPAGDHVLTSHVPLTAGNAPAPAQPDQGWQTPIALESQTASNANLAGIALSAAGPGMVVWQLGGQRNVLMATHFVPNGGGDGGSDWQVPVKISNSYNDIGIAYHGAVAMDAAGDAMAVYYTWNDTHGYTVFATLYQAGVGWKTPVAIDQPFDWSYYPVVAMNAVGDAFVMWQVWNGAWYSMWANRYVHGIGWATAQQIEPTSNITWGQDIAIDGSGNAIATWYEYDGVAYHVYAARFSGTWSSPLQLATNYSFYPSVAMDSLGNGVVAWIEVDGPVVDVSAARYDHVLGWVNATKIESSPYSADYSPGPDTAASNGNLSVVWTMSDVTGTANVFVNRFVSGVGWVGEIDIDGTTYPASQGRVAMDSTGNVTITYAYYPTTTNPANQVVDQAVRYNHLTSTWTYSQLDYSRVGSGSPLVAIDGKGNALTAWNFNDNPDTTTPPRNGILSNHYTSGSGWQPYYQAQRAEWTDQISPSWLQLETNAAGDAIFSFTQNDGPIWNGYAALYKPGTGWGPVTRIAYFNASGVTEEWSAIDGSGNAIVLLRASNGTQFNVYAAYYSVSSGWGPTHRLDNLAGSNKDWLRVAMNARGDGVAIWSGYNGTNWGDYISLFNRTSHTWGAPLQVPTTFSYLGSAMVGIDGSGNVMTVYNAYNGTGYTNYGSYYRPGAGWGSPVNIAHTTMGVNTPYALAMNEAGDFAVSWTDWNGTRNVAVANVFSPATGWGTNTVFYSGIGDEGPATPSLDGAGNTLLAYNAWDGTQYNAYVVVKPAGGAWGAPLRLSSGSGDSSGLTSALDYRGDGFVAWNQFNGIGWDMLARRYVSGTGWMQQYTVNLPVPATPATDTGSANIGVDGHGNAVLGWNEWENDALLPFAATYTVGNGLPTLSVTSPANGTITNNPSVTVSGSTDPGTTVTIDGSPVAVAANGSFSQTYAMADGSHAFVVIAKNAAGLSTQQTTTVTVDTSPPPLAISSPLTGSITKNPVAQVTGTTEPGATVSVNGVQAAVSSLGAFSVSVSLQEGSNVITAIATDSAGNTAAASVTVTLDTVAPPLTLSSPGSAYSNSTFVVVSGSTEAGANVTVDGTAVTVSGSGTFATILSLSQGPHTIVVVATDAAGNQATVSVQITVDTTPPTLAITSPATGTTVSSSTVLVTGTAEVGSTVVVNGYAVSLNSSGAFSIQLPLTPGANTIVATATDPAGNVATQSIEVSFNDQLPAVQTSVNTANTLVWVAVGLAAAALAVGTVSMLRGRKPKAGPAEERKESEPERPAP